MNCVREDVIDDLLLRPVDNLGMVAKLDHELCATRRYEGLGWGLAHM